MFRPTPTLPPARCHLDRHLAHEFGNDAMEHGVVVVALQTQLDKVAARERRLLWPQLDIHVAQARNQQHLARGRRLRDVNGGHERMDNQIGRLSTINISIRARSIAHKRRRTSLQYKTYETIYKIKS